MATTTPNETIQLLDEHQVAETLSVSVASLRRWRLLRRGPRFLKLSTAVRYRHEDLKAWLDSRPVGGEQEQTRSEIEASNA
jgi:predicted DNA-binding transcriptional regulator AlpA